MSTIKANRIENLTTTNGGISINNSGNVGIGTSSPTAALDINDSTGVQLHLSGAPNVATVSDIALSGNSVVRGENSIRHVVNDSGIFTWSVGGTDNLAGTSGSGEKMRKAGAKGAPTKADFKNSAKTAKRKYAVKKA